MAKFMDELNSCFQELEKVKDLKSHFKILQLLFKENSLIEQKIYDKLIEDGYLTSMDEFYRINGVDLVKDQSYSRREITPPEDIPNASNINIESSAKKIHRRTKSGSQRREKDLWDRGSANQLRKIKNTVEAIFYAIKDNFEGSHNLITMRTIK